MKFLILFFFCAISFSAFAQDARISGYVYNLETGQRLHGAHVYWYSAPTMGTVTNEDGAFLLLHHKDCTILIISHLGHQTLRLNIINENELTIGLSVIPYELAGVTVKPIEDARMIISRVIARLDENLPPNPVYYRYFFREVFFSADSVIHIMLENTGKIEHRVAFMWFGSKISIPNPRIRVFSDKGREMLEVFNLGGLVNIEGDNPVHAITRNCFLHRRGSRDFNFQLVGLESIGDRQVYVIDFETDMQVIHPSGRLYIDTDSYAIARKVLHRSGGTETRYIDFVESNGKWYLRNVSHYRLRPDRPSFSYRTTLYNALIDQEKLDYDLIGIQRLWFAEITIRERKESDFLGDFHWEHFNSIPLPDWIVSRITEQRAERGARQETQVE
ncbi:MAG TPA: hypothetical protein DCM62_09745 [Bacteroidales bacterium]|nr:hypothetical protein [Bacteroidales bacterium]